MLKITFPMVLGLYLLATLSLAATVTLLLNW